MVHQRLVDEVFRRAVLALRRGDARDVGRGSVRRVDDETACSVDGPRHAVDAVANVWGVVTVDPAPHLCQILHVGWRYAPYLRLAVRHRLRMHVNLRQVEVASEVLMPWINHLLRVGHRRLQMLQALLHHRVIRWTRSVRRQCHRRHRPVVRVLGVLHVMLVRRRHHGRYRRRYGRYVGADHHLVDVPVVVLHVDDRLVGAEGVRVRVARIDGRALPGINCKRNNKVYLILVRYQVTRLRTA